MYVCIKKNLRHKFLAVQLKNNYCIIKQLIQNLYTNVKN